MTNVCQSVNTMYYINLRNSEAAKTYVFVDDNSTFTEERGVNKLHEEQARKNAPRKTGGANGTTTPAWLLPVRAVLDLSIHISSYLKARFSNLPSSFLPHFRSGFAVHNLQVLLHTFLLPNLPFHLPHHHETIRLETSPSRRIIPQRRREHLIHLGQLEACSWFG